MSRRRSFRDRDERASLTDSAVATAVGNLKELSRTAAAVLTEYIPTREATIEMLFSPTQIERATAARGLVKPSGYVIGYPVGVVQALDQPVTLYIDYNEARCLPIQPDQMQVQHHLIGPLEGVIKAIGAIHMQYEEVKGVLRWLNRNATISAARYYWPPVMQLCPVPMREYQELPTRYAEPRGIGDMLQVIRDSSATMVGAQLLPSDAEARPRSKMWLTFPQVTVRCGVNERYVTDEMTYNL